MTTRFSLLRRLTAAVLTVVTVTMLLVSMPEQAAAYGYQTNLLTTTSKSTDGKDLANEQTIGLSAADIIRANNGELSYVANAHEDANGSRTVTTSLVVQCKNASGAVLAEYTAGETRYWVAHANYLFNSGTKAIPAGTTQIYYRASVHIGTKGDLGLTDMYLKLYDGTAPTHSTAMLSSINGNTISGSVAGTYPSGTTLRYAVKFSEPVNVNNSQSFRVSLSGTAYDATYTTQSPDRMTLYYDYTIPTSGTISDYAAVKMSSISGLVVSDDAGNSLTCDKSLADGFGIYMDNKPPQVQSFGTEASAASVYKAGDAIRFNVYFHEPITVPGSPHISLSNGSTATYVAGSGSETSLATFVYTVGNSDSNTDALAIASVSFSGIVDKVGQAANYGADDHDGYLNAYQLKIDTTAPTATFSNPGINWHSGDYTVSITPTDASGSLVGSGVDELYYVWTSSPGGIAPGFPSNPNVSGDHTISAPASSGTYYLWIKAVDKAGNSASTKSSYTYKFDRTGPTVTVTPHTISGYSAISTVTVAVSDSESGVANQTYYWRNASEATVASGSLDDGITYPDADGLYTLTVAASDNMGNTFLVSAANLTIDKTAPTVTFTPGAAGEHQQSHSVSVVLSDVSAGVASYAYQWTTSPEKPAAGWLPTVETAFTTPSGVSGSYYLHISATDNAGNAGDEVSGAFNLDNTVPTILISPNGNGGDLGRSSYDVGVTVQDSVTLTADLTVQYAFSTTAESSAGATFHPLIGNTVTLSDFSATTYLYIKATDSSGNTAELRSAAFIADIAAPTGSVVNSSGLYLNQPEVNLNFSAADDCTEEADLAMLLTVDGVAGEWSAFAASKTSVGFAATEGTHTISVNYRDRSGKVSEAYNTSFTYDVTPPVINIEYSPESATNGTVTATGTTTAPDVLNGADSHVFTENGSYTFQASDLAGNTSERIAQVTWIDRTAPLISFVSGQFDNRRHQSVSVNINATDNANGIASLQYRFVQDGGPAGDWLQCASGELVTQGSVDGKYLLQAKAVDGVGNEATSQSGWLYLDNTTPVASFQYSPSTRTAQNVQVVTSFSEGVTITNNGGGNTYLFTDNDEFTFEFVDEAGNIGTETAVVTWIDRSHPKATVIITDLSNNSVAQDKWVNYDLLVTIAPPAQSVINSLEFNGAAIGEAEGVSVYDATTCTYLVTTNGLFAFTVHDTDTGLESAGELTARIDKAVPYYQSELRTTEAWTNEDVTVTIMAADNLSSVNYTNGNAHAFTSNGSHTFYFTDAAGNEGSYTATVSNIDNAVPTVSIVYTVNGEAYAGGYTNQDVTATISFDSLSPVTVTNNGGSSTHTFVANDEFIFDFTDAAGNSGSFTAKALKIDKTPPNLAYVTYNTVVWTNQNVVATLHVSDSFSGAANDGATYTFAENGAYTFTAYDNAGNAATVVASATRIDKAPPTLSYTLSPAGITAYSVFATVAADESVTWLNNGGRPSMQFTSNGNFTFQAQDRAGNTAELPVVVENISKASTPVKLTYSATQPTRGNVYVTIAPVAETDVIFVTNNGFSATHIFTENGEFTFNYRNPAGIEGTATASVTNIDLSAPTVEVAYSPSELTSGSVTATMTVSEESVTWPFGMKDGVYTFTGNDKLSVPVVDAVGNVTRVLLEVSWIDTTPPTITLDQPYQSIVMRSQFDPLTGVSAFDANGVPAGLIYDGAVDTSVKGDHAIIYTATDVVGNTSTATKYVTVYDPREFNVIINGRMPVNSEVEMVGRTMTLGTINQQGGLKLLCLPGKKKIGDFKQRGNVITEQHTFTESGYYTLYIQDDERNAKLVYVFVKQ